MRLGQDESVQGVGCPGGCGGSDRQLYEWVQGVDGLGTPIGYWRPRSAAQPGAPYVRNEAPFLGEVATSADGQLYQWVEGVDGLGNPFGFWKRIKRLARRALPIAQRIAPFVPGGSAALTFATPFLRQAGIAGVGDVGALYAAPDGSLYQVQGAEEAGGMQGVGEDELLGVEEELQGFEDELQGLGADEELGGLGADADLDGLDDADDLDGLTDTELEGVADIEPVDGVGDEELDGFDATDDLDGLSEDASQFADDAEPLNGYVQEPGMRGVDAYEPDAPPQTPKFSPAPNAPMWAPLW